MNIRKSESITLIILGLSLVLKLIYPKSILGMLLPMLVFWVLIIGYSFFGWYLFKDKKTKENNLLLSILGGILTTVTIVGVWYKTYIWQPGNAILAIGIFQFVVFLSICFLLYKRQGHDGLKRNYFKGLITRSILFLSISMIFISLPTSFLLNIMYKDEPEYAKLKLQVFDHPENEDFQEQLRAYDLKMIERDRDEMLKARK